jgi:hypothetical protein
MRALARVANWQFGKRAVVFIDGKAFNVLGALPMRLSTDAIGGRSGWLRFSLRFCEVGCDPGLAPPPPCAHRCGFVGRRTDERG